MAGKRRGSLRNVLFVWIVGLALGVGAGALTAMLLLPAEPGAGAEGGTLGQLLRD